MNSWRGFSNSWRRGAHEQDRRKAAGAVSLTKKDFQSDQEVRWCPGCGDYAILNAVQTVLPQLGIPRERFVVVSGIGCSSRFPYYMNTYGFHTIHGRAPAVATGVKIANPELNVWVVTGDGDALSIGGNHLIHAMRRNVGLKILMFNNRIYGLTKGQYSPTSEVGKRTKSTPFGSVDRPLHPLSLALGAEATFVARSVDVYQKHLMEVLKAAAAHEGTAFVEIYQNCNIFNDGAFESFTEKDVRSEMNIELEQGRPDPVRQGAQSRSSLDGKPVRDRHPGRRRERIGRRGARRAQPRSHARVRAEPAGAAGVPGADWRVPRHPGSGARERTMGSGPQGARGEGRRGSRGPTQRGGHLGSQAIDAGEPAGGMT